MHTFKQSPAVIEGIGKVRSAALGSAGMTTLADLLRAKPQQVEQVTANGSMQQIADWKAAAWLMRVDGVTPNLAEAFVAAGIGTVNELADCGLQTLEKAVKAARQRNALGEEPSVYSLAEMQRKAGRLRNSGSVAGVVLNRASGSPVIGAVVSHDDGSTKTDADGYFELHGLSAGKPKLTIAQSGRPPLRCHVIAKIDTLCPFLTIRMQVPERTSAPVQVREIDGKVIFVARGSSVRITTCEMSALPDDTYLRVREISRSGSATLLHLNRTSEEGVIQADRVHVAESALPSGSVVGSILHYKGKALALTSLTMHEVASRNIKSLIGQMKLKRIIRPG